MTAPSEPAIPRTPEEITPAWLTAVLRERGKLDGGRVASIEPTEIGHGRGFIGRVLRLAISYEDVAPDAPASLIAKLPSTVPEVRAIYASAYEREVRFYEQLAERVPLRTPACTWAACAPGGDRAILLLEDVQGGTLGDQIAGCSPAEAELVVERLAGLHARFWDGAGLDDCGWLPGPGSTADFAQSYWQAGWASCLRLAGECAPPAFIDAGERIGERLSQAVRRADAEHSTLTHGDVRPENLLFGERGTADELVFFDWQVVGRRAGARDLAYFLGQSVGVGVRREHEQRLLRHYHRLLEQQGVRGYTFERLVGDYRLGLMTEMFSPVGWARELEDAAERAAGGGEGAEAARVNVEAGVPLLRLMVERNATAILDTEAIGLLPA